jgi:hypothetical protein
LKRIKRFKYGIMWKVCIEGMDGAFHYCHDLYTQIPDYDEAKRLAGDGNAEGNPFGYEICYVAPQRWAFRKARRLA